MLSFQVNENNLINGLTYNLNPKQHSNLIIAYTTDKRMALWQLSGFQQIEKEVTIQVQKRFIYPVSWTFEIHMSYLTISVFFFFCPFIDHAGAFK